ncbi:hypothetical protein TRIP_B350320 [uncultured Desulfatiglans sp.]|uniref:Uncharacterized protein n=1 Tax=Uncultured Desulfatiglans sp. TaxID=1748965 RepID=A0A653ABR2_UNCDX|nr:hypothetical protein TRIP_B350320 [uncultured Desulfatiglans sp.]
MVALKEAIGVVDNLREAAGRSWWGEIGLEGRENERWLGVHYRDLFGSGRKWRARAIRKNHPDLKGAPQEVDVKLRGEDIYLKDRLLGSIEVLYGSENRSRAERELGERPLTCRRVRRVVDRIRCEKKAFQQRFFLSGTTDGADPLPGTFDALVQDLKKETIIQPEFWQQGGEQTLRRLAEGIIEQSAEDLSESRRIGEMRENIMTFFRQRQMLWDAAAPLRAVDDPVIRQDLDTLFNQFLLHPSVLLLRPQGARGQVMETIWRRYRRFLGSNPMDGEEQAQQAGESTYEARRQSLTRFIFRMPDIPTSFEVTGSVRYRSEMDSYRYLDGGVHYTIVAHGRTSPSLRSEPDSPPPVLEGLSVVPVTPQDSSIIRDQQPELVDSEEEKELKSMESRDRNQEIPTPQDPLKELEWKTLELENLDSEVPAQQDSSIIPDQQPKVDGSKSLEQAKQEALSEAREKFREKYFSRQKPPLDGNYNLIGMTGRYTYRSRTLPNGSYGPLTNFHFDQDPWDGDEDFGLVGVQDNERGLIWPAVPFNDTLRDVIDTIIDHTEIDELYQMKKDGVMQKLSNFMEDFKWGLALLLETHNLNLICLRNRIQDSKPKDDTAPLEIFINAYSPLEITCRKWLAMPALTQHTSININERRHIMTYIIRLCYEYIDSLYEGKISKDGAKDEMMSRYVFKKETLPKKFKVEESREWIDYSWETVVKVEALYDESKLVNTNNSNREIIEKDEKYRDIDTASISNDSDDGYVSIEDIEYFNKLNDSNGKIGVGWLPEENKIQRNINTINFMEDSDDSDRGITGIEHLNKMININPLNDGQKNMDNTLKMSSMLYLDSNDDNLYYDPDQYFSIPSDNSETDDSENVNDNIDTHINRK